MVHLNRHKLSDKLLTDLFARLNETIAKLDERQAGLFLNDLLGEEERVMLAKRLGIVVMIMEGYSMYRISRTLKVSPSTVEKINAAIAYGAFENVVPALKKNKLNYMAIVEIIDSILTVGGIMPHYGQSHMRKRRN